MFSTHYRPQHDKQLALWLLSCAVVIYGMILLGGVTRLTESGLSMVEWRPIMGVFPPIGDAAWQAVFEKYQQFPEYQKVNRGMSLAAFKVIFMYEYLHRVLGRLIGLLFIVPFTVFAVRRVLRPGLFPRLLGLLVLGGCQGLLGWYMVQSGLVDRPSVSQYRLTAHLGLAVALYAAIVWQVLSLGLGRQSGESNRGREARGQVTQDQGKQFQGNQVEGQAVLRPLRRWAPVLLGLVYLMILSGGLVAGTDAGYSYPTWPKMGPAFVPPGLYDATPVWLAAFEDVTTIQFNHRLFAYGLFFVIGTFALRLIFQSADRTLRIGGLALIGALLAQVSLGIATLLTHIAVPVAALHQGGAILLLTVMVVVTQRLRSVSATVARESTPSPIRAASALSGS